MDAIDFRLLNEFQRDFPLQSRPFALLAQRLGIAEDVALDRLRALRAAGAVSRVGAVFAPRRLGASTLAALAVPPERLDEVAAMVSAHPEVNHNYEREDRYNLWFVASAADTARLEALLSGIAARSRCAMLSLPLLEEFHIDLGFDLHGRGKAGSVPRRVSGAVEPLEERDRRLVSALQEGLELLPQPFGRLALRCDSGEEAVLARIAGWLESGLIRRFGVVVRHHELGWDANAMCVWDVPDEQVGELGKRLAALPEVSLCYRRQRALPAWRYNLFCMIHGRAREAVLAGVHALEKDFGLTAYPGRVLFSRRRFKQCGARHAPMPERLHG
jgi:DNA-binding Lrp family transcriptional regulator